ncbi:MAG: hypothetical protein FJ265_09460, partial [Planctomycetes bacterium]|nr:hypothetical protein [Planctomycetota bacterium]
KTLQVADIWPGTPSSGASGFAFDGAQWTYFSANDGSTGYELWRTDGTVAQRCSDVQPGVHDSFPVVLGFAGGSCVFTALHGPNAVELYRSQGTASQLVRDLRRGDNGSSAPQHITAQADGRFFFSGVRGALGREAWFSDGSPGSALFLVDTYAGSVGGLGPSTRAASWQNYTFFNNLPGSRLWRTAGTVPSTNQIPNVQVAYADLVPFAGKLYFDASTMATGEELWMLDSPLVAPVLLKDAMPGGGGSIRELTVAGNRLFFSAQDPTSQPGYGNLWVSDGTPAGTQRVFTHGLPGTEPQFLRAFGRQVVFSLGLAPQLWISDGTAAGSVPLGSFAGNHERVVAGDRLFLAGEVPGGGTGVELFVCDGAAITLVKDVRPGSASSDLYGLCAFGDGVLFVADDGVHGFELWKSDGTAAGTQLVIDLRPGAASSCPPSGWNGTTGDGFVHAPGGAARAVFVADDGATGMELWRTDGTAAGTALLADLQPGRLGSWPGKPARCGAQLVFAATQTEAAAPVGRELFAMPAMATAEPVGSPCAAALADVPLARGVGAPALGNAAFALRVSGTPNTLAVLALGFPADQSQAPCEVRFANPLFTLVTVTSAQGQGQLGAGIPGSPAFAGLRLTAQWGVFENGGPYLGVAALSNGVDLVIAAQ